MTPDQINRAIAEACGWKQKSSYWGGSEGIWLTPDGDERTKFPDYCHDLNAMHEAVNALTHADRLSWLGWMDRLTKDPDDKKDPAWFSHRLIQAKPDKWAEAFLRTLGKWEEETKV